MSPTERDQIFLSFVREEEVWQTKLLPVVVQRKVFWWRSGELIILEIACGTYWNQFRRARLLYFFDWWIIIIMLEFDQKIYFFVL